MMMDSLPSDIMQILTASLSLSDVYSLKRASKATLQLVGVCQKHTTDHFDAERGVSVKNVHLLGRDYSLAYRPATHGLMTVKVFKDYYQYFAPTSFVINPTTCTLKLTKHLLRDNLGMDIMMHMCHKNATAVNGIDVAIDAQRLELLVDGHITIDIAMQLLSLRNQRVRRLAIRGELHDMHFLFSMLPRDLESLEIRAERGVHDVRSLPSFFELCLDYLNLCRCYKVCRHPHCVNYNAISSQVRKCGRFPRRVAMSPFPLQAIEWCERNGVTVDFEQSSFFDFEREEVMRRRIS